MKDTENKTMDIENIFENLLKPGNLQEEREVVPGLKVKIRALTAEEIMLAELQCYRPGVPQNISKKLMSAAILARAIIEMNGVPIRNSELSDEENDSRILKTYQKIIALPPVIIEKMYEFYIDVVKKQDSLLLTGDISKELSNF